jgi:hypothetical protein
LTTEAGLSTISPAAILWARTSGKTCTRGMVIDYRAPR